MERIKREKQKAKAVELSEAAQPVAKEDALEKEKQAEEAKERRTSSRLQKKVDTDVVTSKSILKKRTGPEVDAADLEERQS